MNQLTCARVAVLVGTLGLAFPLQAQEHPKKEVQATQQHQTQDVYTCEMHPEVKSDKPGKCPKCGMNLVLASASQTRQMATEKSPDSLTAKEKVQRAKQLLQEAKNELFYNCCIKDPCDRCALDHQSCTCARDLREGSGICSDCYAGWQLGQGKEIKGVSKENVKPKFHSHQH